MRSSCRTYLYGNKDGQHNVPDIAVRMYPTDAVAAFEQAAKLGNEAALANLKQLQQILSVKMK